MISRVLIAGVIAVCSVSLLMFFVEFFVPLSAKYNMDIYCRGTLLSMEEAGGLKEDKKAELAVKLAEAGFTNIRISGTEYARYGEKLNLFVEADYRYSTLKALFARETVVQKMCYNKTAVSRKVVN